MIDNVSGCVFSPHWIQDTHYWLHWSVVVSQRFVHLFKKTRKINQLISLSVVVGRCWLTCVSTCQPGLMKRISRPPAPKESRVCRTPKCSLASSRWPDRLLGWCGRGAGNTKEQYSFLCLLFSYSEWLHKDWRVTWGPDTLFVCRWCCPFCFTKLSLWLEAYAPFTHALQPLTSLDITRMSKWFRPYIRQTLSCFVP